MSHGNLSSDLRGMFFGGLRERKKSLEEILFKILLRKKSIIGS